MTVARLAAAILALVFGALPGPPPAGAHDIPTDARVNIFVKPSGNRLELLLRVPMLVMREVDFPTRGPGYLDIPASDEAVRNAAKLWLVRNIEIRENDSPVPPPRLVRARISLPSDRSFTSFEEALAHLGEPRLPDNLDLYWSQQLLDVLLEYDIASDRSELAIRPRLDRLALNVTTALRFLPPGGAVRAFEFHGDPGIVRLDPRWHQAAIRFAVDGFWHILQGTDHLLFLLCLVIPLRRLRPLIVTVTAFTVAHSISLIASAVGFVPDALWFPPLVETLIAATVFLMALENIVGARIRQRWIAAFAFGLVHGFGFSFALRESLQFAGDHLLTSLLAFNLGVEAGQLAALAVLVPALALLFRYGVRERLGIIILSALVAHTAWHWMMERGEILAKFPVPTLDAALLASLMRGAMAVLVLAGAVWLANGIVRRWTEDAKDAAETAPGGGS